jgi:hypothetical protein
MKFMAMVLVILITAAIPLAAQQTEQESDGYFCVSVPAYKIYAHSKGYVFTYRKNSTETGRLFFPFSWFQFGNEVNDEPVKGKLSVLRAGEAWPYVSIFYRNGQFSHIKLYVRKDENHMSWGAIPAAANLDREFDSADPPKLEFGLKRQ